MKPFDRNGAFLPSLEGNEVRLAVRGAGATLASTTLTLLIQIASTVVLARLLSPRDFGVMAMVTTFSLLLTNFGLNGFTEAVLQADEINHFVASNLFWMNVAAGSLLTVGFAAAGSLLARFYGDPEVAHAAIGISATIFLTCISVQHLALLKRAMRFTSVSINDVVAKIVTVVVSIVLGWVGLGYWALVGGAIALALSTGIGAWYLCRWVPGRPRFGVGTAPLVRFAIHTYGRFSFNYFARNIDNLLVGWRFGSIALGFYKKAYDLFALSVGQSTAPLTNVAVTALSRFRQNPARYRQYFLRALTATAFVGMGLSADLTLVGKDLIRMLLGPGWEESGRIFTLFGPGIGIMLIYYMQGWIHLSLGRADRWLRWGLIEVSATTLLFILALPWGARGIALAWTASYWLLTVPGFQYAGKPIKMSTAPMVSAVWKYIAAAAVAGYASFSFARALPGLPTVSGSLGAFTRVAADSLLFTILYVIAVVLLHRGYGPLRELVGVLRDMVSQRKAIQPASAAAAVPDPASEPVTLGTELTPDGCAAVPGSGNRFAPVSSSRSASDHEGPALAAAPGKSAGGRR